jgi:geranylgeranyl pyrophosphate synthase/predicted secreted hydrolase
MAKQMLALAPSIAQASGGVDLATEDLPHASSATEWWYINSHITLAGGREVSLFAAFFKIAKGRDETTGAPLFAHSCTRAITDVDGKAYLSDSRVDISAPEMGIERIKRGQGARDPRLNRAMLEVLEKGRVPTPDRVFTDDVKLAADRLDLQYADARFDKRDDGTYRLRLCSKRLGAGCDLVFTPECAPVRHGDDGVVRGHGGEPMFYYFIPRCRVDGSVTLGGVATPTARAMGWYDHEFSLPVRRPSAPQEIAWNWVAAQLDSGQQFTAYSLVRPDDGAVLYQWAVLVDADGADLRSTEVAFQPRRNFRSKRTFHDYPVSWTVSAPELDVELRVDAELDDQEFITCISKPAFWEGRCRAAGRIGQRTVRGLAYFERSGFSPIQTLDQFFAAVGEEVRASVAELLPLPATQSSARPLIASEDRPEYMDGVDVAQLADALWRPIREIADRGGKSWRSYAALASCDAVGGDSRHFLQWLAVPELLHVGSLIVDDVEDGSLVRRGGPACHVVHGEPIAINAGTASYFIAQRLLQSERISDADKLRLYDLYFEAMRAGHAGQALDLAGLHGLLPYAVRTGDTRLLERRILAIHRLKTAAPAAALARMGAIAGGGSDLQVDAIGRFFEGLGVAFQIVDDVLNLRGFEGDLKARGEDLSRGTVTLPVAKGLGRLDKPEREALWKLLQLETDDEARLSEAIAMLERVDAIEACAEQAHELVELAWRRADPLLPDSLPKVMLRAFGWYVLERHY